MNPSPPETATASQAANFERQRWLALAVLCAGEVMMVLDTTIVNVALSAIRAAFAFDEATLSWVVNAYVLLFGGFLLLSGKLGDMIGHRRVFLGGMLVFTLASLLCGLAVSQTMLIIARGVQGLGGAAISAVAFALVADLFTTPVDRARAFAYFSFVSSVGGSAGVLLGGVLTQALHWSAIFLVNVPLGVFAFFYAARLLPPQSDAPKAGRLDIPGSVLATSGNLLLVWAIIESSRLGWQAAPVWVALGLAAMLLLAFMLTQHFRADPLVPLPLLLRRNIAASAVIALLWAGAMFSWFFLAALLCQRVWNYDALHTGMAFLPTTLVMAVFSLGLSDKIVLRFGVRSPLVVGMGCMALGLWLFALVPPVGTLAAYALFMLPGMVLIGIGSGVAFNPLLVAAMGEVGPSESGLVSGIVNTSFMVGGALGLAILAALANWRSAESQTHGQPLGQTPIAPEALLAGYHLAFTAAAIASLLALIAAFWLQNKATQTAAAH